MNGDLPIDSEALKIFFVEHISKFCDKCGTEYNANDIFVVNDAGASVIIQAQCHKCKAIYLAQVIKPLQMSKKIPIRLDISPLLLKEYYQAGAISADEVLALRKKLLSAHTLSVLKSAIGHGQATKQKEAKTVTSLV